MPPKVQTKCNYYCTIADCNALMNDEAGLHNDWSGTSAKAHPWIKSSTMEYEGKRVFVSAKLGPYRCKKCRDILPWLKYSGRKKFDLDRPYGYVPQKPVKERQGDRPGRKESAATQLKNELAESEEFGE